MKNVIYILFFIFTANLSFGQSPFTPAGSGNKMSGKYYFTDSLGFIKYANNGDSVLGVDIRGKLVQKVNGTGGNNSTILLSGSVIWDSNFVFHNTSLTYKILGRQYSAAYSTFSIAGSDPVDPHYSVVYADTLGNVGVINQPAGTPANIPQVNPLSQILLAIYYVPASSDSPSGGFPPTEITNTTVYKENVEWVVGGTATGVSGAYTVNPYAGLLSTRVPALINGEYLEYTNGATISAATFSYLSFELRLGAAFDVSTNLVVSFYLDGSPVSSSIVLTSGSYGFTRTTTGSYQLIAFGINNFNFFGGALFNKVHIDFTGTNASGFQIDNVVLQGGGTVVSNAGVITYNNRAGNVLPLRVDNQWASDSSAISSDSLIYNFYNNGNLVFTLPTLKRNLVVETPLTLRSGTNVDTLGSSGGSGTGVYAGSGLTQKNDSTIESKFRDTTISGRAALYNSSVDIRLNNAIFLPDTYSAYQGVIYKNGLPFIHNYSEVGSDGYNTFTGLYSGNFTLGTGGGASNFGSTNTGTGAYTLNSLTTGKDNTATGKGGLYLTTTGKYNTANGVDALRANTTGDANVAIGVDALFYNTIGIGNVAMGNNSLLNNINGGSNSSIGVNSLFSNSSGSENVGVGAYTMVQLNGNYDVAIGSTAGYSITVGTGNTFIGTQAGNNASQKTDPNNSMALGYRSYTTKDNQIVIGDTSIIETLLKGSVSISSGAYVSPNAKSIFDVVSTTKGSHAAPSMTNAQMNAIASPHSGDIVSNTDSSNRLFLYTGSAWKGLAFTSETGWGVNGNSGTTPGTNFIGTTDDAGLLFKINGVQAGYLDNVNDNLSFGINSLPYTLPGESNVAFGNNTLKVNNIGYSNSGFGNGVLSANTDGVGNSANGTVALNANTTGNFNSANGYGSIASNKTGSFNTAAGGYSLYSAESNNVNNNTVLGYQSLYTLQRGRNNIAIGFRVGQYASTGTAPYYNDTMTNSIMIGSNISPLATNQTNQIIIGDSAIGLGSNATVLGNSSTVLSKIYGTTALGYGANVSSASAIVPTGNIFHVTGTTTITSITATNVVAGAEITIIFDGALTFTDGSNLKLAGDFVTTADDAIKLAYDGTNFYEIARSVN